MKPKVAKELTIKTSDQDYGKILKSLGDCRFQIELQDGTTKIGVLRGTMKKRSWIQVGDYCLLSYRDFQDNKVDILQKYTDEEVRKLKKMGEIEIKKTNVEEENENELHVEFDGNDDTL